VRRGRQGEHANDGRVEAEELKEEDLSEAARQALRLKAADAFGVTREVQKQLLAGEGGRILRGLFHRFCQHLVDGSLPPLLIACLGLVRYVAIPKGDPPTGIRTIAI